MRLDLRGPRARDDLERALNQAYRGAPGNFRPTRARRDVSQSRGRTGPREPGGDGDSDRRRQAGVRTSSPIWPCMPAVLTAVGPSAPEIAPAICNTLYALTGKRARKLPVSAADLA